MRVSLLVLTLFIGSVPVVLAHPPASLVMDSEGAIYYSDLAHVWVLQLDGTKRIAVRDVHTHELWLDADDNLYGKDEANVGDLYRHRVWRLAPDGTLTDVLPWREGHFTDYYDYGFARDEIGRSYVLRRNPNRVDVWEDGERIQSLDLGAPESTPGWIIASSSGVTHFTLGGNLWRWDPQTPSPTRVAENLIERTDTFGFLQDRHALMGLWHGSEDEVYLSVFSGQVVKRIKPDGTTTVAARSAGDWSPVSGLVAPDGALWIQEFSTSNQTRVRRIAADGSESLFSDTMAPVYPASSPTQPNRTVLVLVALLASLTLLAVAIRAQTRLRPEM